MYRKRNGSRGFSFSKLAAQITSSGASHSAAGDAAVNPAANSSADNNNTPDSARARSAGAHSGTSPASNSPTAIPPLQLDILHSHQLASPAGFSPLDPLAFQVTSIVPTERLSKVVHRTLIKHSILDEQGNVCTMSINGAKFAHQMAVLASQKRQKDVIELLFYWEEEVQRFKKLMGEIEELNGLIAGVEDDIKRLSQDNDGTLDGGQRSAGSDSDTADNGDGAERGERRRILRERLDQIKFARERVRMKIRMRPSQRTAEIEGDRDDLVERFASGGFANSEIANARRWTEGLINARSSAAPDTRLPTNAGSIHVEYHQPTEQLPEYHVVAAR